MTVEPQEPVQTATGEEWTIDELAARTGLTVRTTRYYASMGLLPPAARRGRLAYYDERHRARLDLIRTMQERGLTLAAIEQYLTAMSDDTPASDLELRRALVSSWAPLPTETIDRAELEQRAGRPLSDREVGLLVRRGAVVRVGSDFETRPTLRVNLDLLDLDIPETSLDSAGVAIRRHMDALALELREVMRSEVLAPLRASGRPLDTAEFEQTMARLRQLTLDAVVSNFQEATVGLVDGTLLAHSD